MKNKWNEKNKGSLATLAQQNKVVVLGYVALSQDNSVATNTAQISHYQALYTYSNQ